MRPSAKTIKAKGDRLLNKHFPDLKCVICGEKGYFHHLLPKSRYARYRWRLENLLPLCHSHHIFSPTMAPHSQNYHAVEAFAQWVKKNYRWKYVWTKEASENYAVSQINWQALYDQLVLDLKANRSWNKKGK
jgi:hypothetical protein